MNILSSSQLRELKPVNTILKYLNQCVPVLIGIFIFCNPFPHTTCIKEICLYLSVFFILTLILLKGVDFTFKTPLTLPFALYVVWACASIFWSIDKGNSFHDFYAHLLKYIVLYYILINFFNSRKRFVILIWIIIISTAVFSIRGMINFYIVLGNPISARLIPEAQAAINTTGIITLFATLLSLFHFLRENKLYRKVILFVCFLATLTAMFLTYSRGALIAFCFSSIVLFYGNKKRMIILLALIPLAAGSLVIVSPEFKNRLYPAEILNNLRIGIYYTSLEIIKDHPIAGIGFGMEAFQKHMWNVYNAKTPSKWRRSGPFQHPHNFLLDVTVRLGFVGLILFGFILFSAFRIIRVILRCGKDDFIRGWGVCSMAVLTGVLIAGLFGKIVSGQSAIILHTLLAMITILWRIDQGTDGRDIRVS